MKILYFARKQCKRSKNLYEFLKKNSTFIIYHEFDNHKEAKIHIKKYRYKKFDYLITFRSLFIVPQYLINNCKLSINFHPGTPKYRGIGCVNYALYNNEKYFGSTAHIIDKKIDHGPIIDVKKFKLKKTNQLDDILQLTWDNMLKQAKKILKNSFCDRNYINQSIKDYEGDKWSNKIYSRNDLNKFYKIDLKSNKKDFNKKVRATSNKNFKPYIIFHDKKFELKD
tara:strand:- start:330 stop:1004 length:675 start_codon:yes stop_codon:yes gene_type:complete